MVTFQLTSEENAQFIDQLVEHDKRCIVYNSTVSKSTGRLTWCFTPQSDGSRVAWIACNCGFIFDLG